MKVLLLVLLPVLGVAQNVFKAKMDIHEMWENYDVCHEDIMVIWGQIADTVFFSYDNRLLRLWKPLTYPYELFDQVNRLMVRHPHDSYKILEDKNSNLYVIRIAHNEQGLVIWLNGITNRIFNIHFDFTPNKICQ
jgi:hypothetical protein